MRVVLFVCLCVLLFFPSISEAKWCQGLGVGRVSRLVFAVVSATLPT